MSKYVVVHDPDVEGFFGVIDEEKLQKSTRYLDDHLAVGMTEPVANRVAAFWNACHGVRPIGVPLMRDALKLLVRTRRHDEGCGLSDGKSCDCGISQAIGALALAEDGS